MFIPVTQDHGCERHGGGILGREILARENLFGEFDFRFFEIPRAQGNTPRLSRSAVVPGAVPEMAFGIQTFGEPTISDFELSRVRSFWPWHVGLPS